MICNEVISFEELTRSYAVTPKQPQTIMAFPNSAPPDHASWRADVMKSCIVLAIEELWTEHAACQSTTCLQLMHRPCAVVTATSFKVGALKLVPATRKILVASASGDVLKHPHLDLGVLDAPNPEGDFSGQRFYLSPDLPNPEKASQQPFLAPLWFVSPANDEAGGNIVICMETKLVGTKRIPIPYMKNTVYLKAGTVLRASVPAAEDGEPPMKRQKKA